MLSKKQLNDYETNGFVILDYQLPQNDLEEIRSASDRVIAKHPQYRDYCPMLLKYDLHFLSYARNENILNCVKQVLGPDVALWNQSFFAKPAINGKATPWHQDGQYWPIRPLATCTVWVAIDDTNEENGCLEFIPGSHKKKETLSHYTDNNPNYTLNQELEKSNYDPDKSFSLCLKAGQMSIHDVYLVHGSKENTSSHSRRGMTMRFMPTTSYFDRSFAHKISIDTGIDHRERTLFLMAGIDKSGKNDFRIRK